MIKIDVKKGDTILVGRFKNKRTKVKTIGYFGYERIWIKFNK